MSLAAPVAGRREAVDLVAAVLMVGLTFSWGLNGVAAKLTYVGYSPVFLSLARSFIGGVVIALWCAWRGIPIFDRDGTLWLGLFAGLLFAVEFLLILGGLDYTSVARGALMVNTMPFWVLIGAHFVLGERMTTLKVAGLVLAFAGVVLVFSDQLSVPGPHALAGDAMSLVAGMLWGATTLVIKGTKLSEAGPEKLLLYQLAVAAAVSLVVLPFFGPALRAPSLLSTGALLFQSLFVVGVTFLVWFWLMRRYPASGLSSFIFMTPVFGVLCGGVLLGEPLSLRIVAALVLVAAGLLLANRPPRRPVRPVP